MNGWNVNISKSVKNADTIVNASNGLKMVYNGN